jgi:hypothetical protein
MKAQFCLLLAMALTIGCAAEETVPTAKLPSQEAEKSASSEIGNSDGQVAATLKSDVEIAELKATFESLSDEFDQLDTEFRSMIRGAGIQQAIEKYNDKFAHCADRMMEIYHAYPGSEFAIQCLEQVLNRMPYGQRANRAFDLMLTNHRDNEKLAMEAYRLRSGRPSKASETRLKRLMTEPANKKTKGVATFAMAAYMDSIIQLKNQIPESLDDTLSAFDRSSVAYIKDSSFDEQTVIAYYEQVLDQYANVKVVDGVNQTLGELTNQTRHFKTKIDPEGPKPELDMLAPEIKGQDLTGTTFKLSDYRGKVVLLDFWGDW